MHSQLTHNEQALRLFFTDDVYLVNEPVQQYDLQEKPSVESKEKAPLKVEEQSAKIEVPVIAETPAVTQAVNFVYLGKNQKNILVLVNDAENSVCSKEGMEFLTKIVGAVGLTSKDIAILNFARNAHARYESLKSFFGFRLLMSFGVSASELGLEKEFPLHDLELYNDVEIIFTSNLHPLSSDLSAKKQLWGNLKQLKYV
ncbi:hypothetical protein [Pedobacter montanisoli]|uniref:Uncharacterized protein n=1 Tax=Pedobacter montanisoli TaxID=2923277 RepID=A0ABS9ZU14_9SPHI|nr:hypothetical protein [Pedobacter montanisoli]MCJ0742099.1 hypothetical protein [Pedobacter montanisoli]